MHVVKNVTESLTATIFNIKGKTKDTWKSRRDLMDERLKKSLHLRPQSNSSSLIMHMTCYHLTKDEKQKILDFLKLLKFPDGYASNISRCIKGGEFKLSRMKSHDFYVFIQRVLPLSIRGCLTKEVRLLLYELNAAGYLVQYRYGSGSGLCMCNKVFIIDKGLPSLWCSVSMSLMNESAMSGPRKGALKKPHKSSSRHEILKPSKLSKSQHVSHPHKSVRENDIQLEDEEIQEEVQTESGDVPKPCKSSSRHEISKPSKLSKSQHVSHPHKSVREDNIQESHPKVLRKRQAYMQSEDQEIQEEVQTESGDHEDYSEDDHEVNSPQTETEIGSTSHGTSVTRKETRALNEAKKRRLDKGKLVFEINECTGRIIRQDSQRFITKDCNNVSVLFFRGKLLFNLIPPAVGTKSVARRIDMVSRREGENVTAINSYEIAHYCEKKKKMVSKEAVAVLNKLRSEEAAGLGTPAEICFKLLKRVAGHLRGCSASKKEILAVENLRAIVESEKNISAALEEKLKEVAVEQDEIKKCMGLMMKEIQSLSKLVPDKSS
nr:hypothetical protein [Tanacetum cinerariifolium]